MTEPFNCLIMGAAGRDFHNFQTFFRSHPSFRVCAFTAAQIPNIDSRTFPRSLAGPEYPEGIPICSELQLPQLIRQFKVDFVFLSYSDLSHAEVMHKAARVQASGASFVLLGPQHTQLISSKPVISVTAVRTGAGKSPVSLWLAQGILRNGFRAAVIRHPMPYGDLETQAVQRFATFEDLDRLNCTVEEREEYQPYIENGITIFSGVDYNAILKLAEAEADIVLWDGGNNDFSFLRPTVSIVVVDALRPGHEIGYYPGETNFLQADIVVINKVGNVCPETLTGIRERIRQHNSTAHVIEADLEISVDQPEAIAGMRVLVVEDGPTLTHGEMSYGAGTIAARRYGAHEIIDPRPHAVGSLAQAFQDFPHLGNVVPALGYSPEQLRDLGETIDGCGADIVVDASPCRLSRVLNLKTRIVRASYQFKQISGVPLMELVRQGLQEIHAVQR